jgi:hypothetical protein
MIVYNISDLYGQRGHGLYFPSSRIYGGGHLIIPAFPTHLPSWGVQRSYFRTSKNQRYYSDDD